MRGRHRRAGTRPRRREPSASTIALYTFGLLDPGMRPETWAEFSRRGIAVHGRSTDAPGFVARATGNPDREDVYEVGADFGPWGASELPLGLPDFAGHDPHVHIATLSLWRDVASARGFVYGGLHRDALRQRHDWFVKGPWPGHVLWAVEEGEQPVWSDGTSRLEALARDGDSADAFTFGSPWGRA